MIARKLIKSIDDNGEEIGHEIHLVQDKKDWTLCGINSVGDDGLRYDTKKDITCIHCISLVQECKAFRLNGGEKIE